MYDIILQYKELNRILKIENGEGEEGNKYEEKMEEYKNDMSNTMESYKDKFSANMPNMNSIPNMPNFGNMSSFTSGLKMPSL